MKSHVEKNCTEAFDVSTPKLHHSILSVSNFSFTSKSVSSRRRKILFKPCRRRRPLIWLVCYVRRKNPIGGWLLYYFIGLYVGLFISIALIVPSLSNYNPLEWDDKFHYFLFIITTIPGEILLLAQVLLSIYLLSKKRRDWKHIEILKKVLFADVVFSAISIPIEVSLWPVSVFFSIYSAILSLIWFFYFRKSVRVQYVFKDKLWNPEILYPSVKVKKT